MVMLSAPNAASKAIKHGRLTRKLRHSELKRNVKQHRLKHALQT